MRRLMLFLFVFSSVFLLAVSVFVNINVRKSVKITEENMQLKLLYAAGRLAALVSIEELDGFVTIEDKDRNDYGVLKRKLLHFTEETDIFDAYYIRPFKDYAEYVADADTSIYTSVGLGDRIDYNKYKILKKTVDRLTSTVGDFGEYEDFWYGLMTAYCPIFNEAGELKYIAGTDIRDETIIVHNRIVVALTFVKVICIIFSFVCAVIGISVTLENSKTKSFERQKKVLLKKYIRNIRKKELRKLLAPINNTRHFFVINPHSFITEGSLKKITEDIDKAFVEGGNYTVYVTKHCRDAVRAVRSFMLETPISDSVRIYAVGGDGILFDCLNGMADFENASITNIPCGNANDFVRAFGENSKEKFFDIKRLTTAPVRHVDILDCGSNKAFIEANIGIVGNTIIMANKFLRKHSGRMVRRFTDKIYLISAVITLFSKKATYQYYTLIIDGKDYSGYYANIHFANIACDGGSFVPSPYAKADDGAIDVIMLPYSHGLKLLGKVANRNNGKFEKGGDFTYLRCKSAYVTSSRQLSIQLDGEGFFTHEFKIKIIEGGIKFFAPADVNFHDYSYRAYKKGRKNEEK